MSKQIVVNVPLKGLSTGQRTVQYEGFGFQGRECQDATAFLSKALGAMQEEELKPEAYEPDISQNIRENN